MGCPKWGGGLEAKKHGEGISLERCRVCYGLLARPFVLEKMREEWMIEAILDFGSKSIGKTIDKVDEIQRPHCEVAMDKIVDPEQTHI